MYKPYEQRVVDEKTELDDKLIKLGTFIDSDFFDTLSLQNKELLVCQEGVMKDYSNILKARIELFVPEKLEE